MRRFSGTSESPRRSTVSGAWPSMRLPSKVISPRLGFSTPAIVAIVVVFPAPLLPTSPTSWPSSTCMARPWTAATRP